MGKKITVEFKDTAVYKDLQEISRLMKEPPEELLERAFKEWVQLREDLDDVREAKKAIEEFARTGVSYSSEEIRKELAKRGQPS